MVLNQPEGGGRVQTVIIICFFMRRDIFSSPLNLSVRLT
jgi:hypothetical protein